jgi:hypothetical protein
MIVASKRDIMALVRKEDWIAINKYADGTVTGITDKLRKFARKQLHKHNLLTFSDCVEMQELGDIYFCQHYYRRNYEENDYFNNSQFTEYNIDKVTFPIHTTRVRTSIFYWGEYTNFNHEAIGRSNIEVIEETLEGCEALSINGVGIGSGEHAYLYGDILTGKKRYLREAKELVSSLADYCILDEDRASELEMEYQEEQWKDYGLNDIITELVKRYNSFLSFEIDGDDIDEDSVEIKVSTFYSKEDYPEYDGSGFDFHCEKFAKLLSCTDLLELVTNDKAKGELRQEIACEGMEQLELAI